MRTRKWAADLIGSDTETTLARGVGYTFYAWLSAVNLFINSIFWAFMVDIFNVDQVKRMFAFIGAGGTLGALISGWVTNFVSGHDRIGVLAGGVNADRGGPVLRGNRRDADTGTGRCAAQGIPISASPPPHRQRSREKSLSVAGISTE